MKGRTWEKAGTPPYRHSHHLTATGRNTKRADSQMAENRSLNLRCNAGFRGLRSLFGPDLGRSLKNPVYPLEPIASKRRVFVFETAGGNSLARTLENDLQITASCAPGRAVFRQRALPDHGLRHGSVSHCTGAFKRNNLGGYDAAHVRRVCAWRGNV